MCGIFGGVLAGKDVEGVADAFISDLKHRGPDDSGAFINEESGIFIGNTRLSIIDLENGKQPFASDDNKVQCVQNGEIYNYKEINSSLVSAGHTLKTNCDTESILATYLKYGVDGLREFNGMFAIAIVDSNKGQICLIRDRLGVKPLYYYWDGVKFIFCSEIKPILKHLDKVEFNVHGFYSYLKYNYVIGPQTIYKNIYQVRPGHYLTYSEKRIEESKYWDIDQIEERYPKYNSERISENHELLVDAINLRNRSDVPVGAFLSGGIDSSLISSIYTEVVSKQLETYTIQFSDKDLDESLIAEQLSRHLGIRNTTVQFPSQIESEWIKILFHLDQPHGDTSFIPTSVLCAEYSKQLKVALTGDGGDEIFCGYERYKKYLIERQHHNILEEYLSEVSIFHDDEITSMMAADCEDVRSALGGQLQECYHDNAFKCSVNKLLYLDLKTILPDNNLIKPDRMGMMHSVESRNPFMDYRLAELNFKIKKTYSDFKLKCALKTILKNIVGRDIVPENKQTFSVPYSALRSNVLTADKVLQQCEKIYPIIESVFNYQALVQQVRHSESNNEIRKLRNLMGLFYWVENSLAA